MNKSSTQIVRVTRKKCSSSFSLDSIFQLVPSHGTTWDRFLIQSYLSSAASYLTTPLCHICGINQAKEIYLQLFKNNLRIITYMKEEPPSLPLGFQCLCSVRTLFTSLREYSWPQQSVVHFFLPLTESSKGMQIMRFGNLHLSGPRIWALPHNTSTISQRMASTTLDPQGILRGTVFKYLKLEGNSYVIKFNSHFEFEAQDSVAYPRCPRKLVAHGPR